VTSAGAVIEQLRRSFDEVARDPSLIVRECAWRPAASAEAISARRGALPDELLDFLGAADGVRFEWEYAGDPAPDDEVGVGGGLHVPKLEDAVWIPDPFGRPGRFLLVDDVGRGFGSYYRWEDGSPLSRAKIVYTDKGDLYASSATVCDSFYEYLDLARQHRFRADWADLVSFKRLNARR
jgi:hypothetical protein